MLELTDFYSYQENGKTYLVIDGNEDSVLCKENQNDHEKQSYIQMLQDFEDNPEMTLQVNDLLTLTKEDIQRYGGIRFVCDELVSLGDENPNMYMKKFRMMNDVAKAFIKIRLYMDFDYVA